MEQIKECDSEINLETDSTSEQDRESECLDEEIESKEPASPPYRFTEVIQLSSSKKKGRTAGIVYLSRIPPYMSINKVRHLLSQFGAVTRIFLQPEDPMIRRRRKRQGGKKKQRFEEGWVEFGDKEVAKQVAESVNNTSIGGKKGNFHYFDLWTVKYLHGFKWYHLTESIAYQNAVREQRLRTEISQVKRENQFYLQNVEKGKEIKAIQERKTRQNKELKEVPEMRHQQKQVQSESDNQIEQPMSASFLAKILPNSVND